MTKIPIQFVPIGCLAGLGWEKNSCYLLGLSHWNGETHIIHMICSLFWYKASKTFTAINGVYMEITTTCLITSVIRYIHVFGAFCVLAHFLEINVFNYVFTYLLMSYNMIILYFHLRLKLCFIIHIAFYIDAVFTLSILSFTILTKTLTEYESRVFCK